MDHLSGCCGLFSGAVHFPVKNQLMGFGSQPWISVLYLFLYFLCSFLAAFYFLCLAIETNHATKEAQNFC